MAKGANQNEATFSFRNHVEMCDWESGVRISGVMRWELSGTKGQEQNPPVNSTNSDLEPVEIKPI